jgi:restriction endonuclease Mrr
MNLFMFCPVLRKFEKLIRDLMLALGATSSEISSKRKYGNSPADVDIIADFAHLGIRIYIQAKMHRGSSDKKAVDQVLKAMGHDNEDGGLPIYGWVVTTGTFDDEATNWADQNGIRVINGEELSEMILSVGLDHF